MSAGEKCTSDRSYDVVVVGGGITGTLLSKVLAELAFRDGKAISILILEAGTGIADGDIAHDSYLQTYYGALAKTPNAPYPTSVNAPSPEDLAFLKPPNDRYFIQQGPLSFGSNNLRMLGGTTHHWMGISLRMLRADFKMRKNYGIGVDWPLDYDAFLPYYEKAEWELGVSADVQDQVQVEGVSPADFGNYAFPMHRVPVSYLDGTLQQAIGANFRFERNGQIYPTAKLIPLPQARNSLPNASAIDPRRGYLHSSRVPTNGYNPVGAPENPSIGAGQRCEGNASCIPICPSRAKYTALKTLQQLGELSKLPGIRIDVITKAVASEVTLGADGNVSAIGYLKYDEPTLSYAASCSVSARRFVLASSAIENAKLLLASRSQLDKGVANASETLGKHLMDHPFILSWALMPPDKPVFGFRGPLVTSDLPLRHGDFRKKHSAFRTDVGNSGWGLADAAPYMDLERLIDPESFSGKYPDKLAAEIVARSPLSGAELRSRIRSQVARQITLGFLMEQLPDPKNKVAINDARRDALGLHKPVITYDIDEYSRNGMAVAYEFASALYKRMGATEFTDHAAPLGTPIQVGKRTFKYIGAGHIMGTHRMGTGPRDSVVNCEQQSWDHPNLYIVGCGSMPTVGTSNPTLTAAALSIKSAEHLYKNLDLAGR